MADGDAIDQLRHSLERHGYSESRLCDALGQQDGRPSLRSDLPLYLRRVAPPTPLNTLVKLFALRVWVETAAAREAFAPVALGRYVSMGLLETGDGGVRARVALSLCNGLWLAHDFADAQDAGMAADHVLGISPATLTLAKLTVQRQANLALDLGAGCGVQGLLVARKCGRVIAVDTNARALNFTQFNARLNGIANVECRLGSLFEPVAGLQFDLIVCNPPYVISPESHYQFRDSGLPGDRICEQVIRVAPTYLRDGGVACALCSWAHRKEAPWSQRLRHWVADSGCDALLVHGATQDPLSYAASWTRAADPTAYGDTLDRWCDYYRRLGIEALSVGGIILRRRPGVAHWVRTESLPKTLTDSCSEQILRIFEAEDYLASHTQPEDLLAQTYRLADAVRVTQSLVTRQGRLVPDTIQMESRRGLALRGTVDASVLQVVARCDGSRRLSEIVAGLARASKADEQEMRRSAVVLARHLVGCGFLVPAEGAGVSDPNSPCGEPGADADTNTPPGLHPAEERKVSYE